MAATALWMSSQLVTAGCEEDLLRMYPKPIAAKTADTWEWFEQLVQRYARDSPVFGAIGRSSMPEYLEFISFNMDRI